MCQAALTQRIEYETSWLYDAGIYHRLGKNFDTRFVVYYTDVSDYIALDNDKYNVGGTERPYAYNVDSVQFYGVEFEFSSTFDNLTIFGNYTYMDNKVDETGGLPITFWTDLPPKHKANLGLRYHLRDNILLTCDERYVGERKSERGHTIDGFMTTDIGIQYTFLKNKAKLFGYVNNIFGKSYEEVYGYPMPRQTFGVQMKYTF